MLNSFPFSGFIVPIPSGIVNIYNTTQTLTNDLIAGDLILTDTTLNTAGYRIYCKSLTMTGSTIQNNGSDGSSATGGAGGVAGTLGSGGDGGTFAISTVAPDNLYFASIGGSGGRGGDGSAGSGLAGGVATFNPPSGFKLGSPYSFTMFQYGYQMQLDSTTFTLITRSVRGGAGGGQGGGPVLGSGNGGGGGGGGGVILICCSGNVSMEDSKITANGGNGANGSNTPPYTSGGGGGGGGGGVLIRCASFFAKAAEFKGIQVRGGAAGTTASPSGTGSYGHIYINTATNAYHYTGGDLGGLQNVVLS